MFNKKKNGFTLIELLVVIALMLSILGIAIVSFINISNRKKQEAWEDVKAQIETAVTEYFTANEYLFEGFADGSDGSISVGMLVNEDYLNKITDPRNGEVIDECSRIEVVKTGNKYTANFKETEVIAKNEEGVCIDKNLVEVKEPGAPSGEVKYYDKDNNEKNTTGWFNISLLGESGNLKVCISGNTNGNGPIASATIGRFETTRDNNNFCTVLTNDGVYSNILMSLTNTSGKKWQVYNTIKKDTTKPKGTLSIRQKDSWASRYVYLDLSAEDTTSGIDSFEVGTNYFNGTKGVKSWIRNDGTYDFGNVSYNGDTLNLEGKITDVAGNLFTDLKDDYTLYTDCQEANRIADGNWYNKSGATCSNKCGGKIAQERNTKDKNSGNSCTEKQSQDANCGGKKVKNYSYRCSNVCGGGTKYKTPNYVSTIDSNHSCGSGTEVADGSCGGTTTTWGSWGKCSKACGTGKQTRTGTKYSTYDRSNCGSVSDSRNCNTQACVCEDITINIPKWSGTSSFTVSASSSSAITKISSVFYEKEPGNKYTTNNEKSNVTSKIAQCSPSYYNCKSSYTYLSVCATNKCGRKVCEYKQANSTSQTRHYDNRKTK